MAECSDDVAAWLDRLGLAVYTENFHFAGYSSLQQCGSLSKDHLISIGVVNLSHVYQLCKDLERMKAEGEIDLQNNPLPPRSLSPSNLSPTDGSHDQHKDVPSKLRSNPLRRFASFFTHGKSNTARGTPSQRQYHKKDNDDDSPKALPRRWSLRKTVTESKFFRWHSMRVTSDGATFGGTYNN